MLRYDAAWLIEYYAAEQPVRPEIPYSLLATEFTLERSSVPFQLTRATTVEPRLAFDETVARLVSLDAGVLRVQPCRYSDGIRSNYAMDGEGGLREILRAEYGPRLPALDDARLSNGIGTAIVVFDAAGKPYLPRRAPKQSVFPGGYHCTASGEAVWRDDGEMFENHIGSELEEEAGLTRADIHDVKMLGLCREFLRGGKPQIFYSAVMDLSAEELADRRRAAIAAQLRRGRQEILDEVLKELTPETLAQCTLECRANLALA